MTHRTNWKVLGPPDPIPGNVTDIRDAGDNYTAIALAIVHARDELSKITSTVEGSEMISEAVDAVRSDAKTIKTALDQVQNRYNVVAGRISVYADALAKDQEEANQAEAAAQNAQTALDNANSQIKQYSAQMADAKNTRFLLNAQLTGAAIGIGDQSALQQQRDQNDSFIGQTQYHLDEANAAKALAERQLAEAKAKLEAAKKDIKRVGDDAASMIWGIINSDGLNNDYLKQAIKIIGGFLLDVVEKLADCMADVFEGIEKMALALANVLKDLNDLGLGLLEGVVTGQWGKAEKALGSLGEHALDYVAGLAIATRGLGKIASMVGAVISIIPPLAEVGFIASSLGLGLQAVSLFCNGALASAGRISRSDLKDSALDFGASAISAALSLIPTAVLPKESVALLLFRDLKFGIQTAKFLNFNPVTWTETPYVYHNPSYNFQSPHYSAGDMIFPTGGLSLVMTGVSGFGSMGRVYFESMADTAHSFRSQLAAW